MGIVFSYSLLPTNQKRVSLTSNHCGERLGWPHSGPGRGHGVRRSQRRKCEGDCHGDGRSVREGRHGKPIVTRQAACEQKRAETSGQPTEESGENDTMRH